MDPVYSAIQELLYHPRVGTHIGLVQADDAGFHEHSRCAVATARRAAIHKTAHELAQPDKIKRMMLHLDIDGVGPGARHTHALCIGIDTGRQAGIHEIGRLAVLPKLDHLVDAARLVSRVHRGWLHARVHRSRAGRARCGADCGCLDLPARRRRLPPTQCQRRHSRRESLAS